MAANVCLENESCPEFSTIASYGVHLSNGEVDGIDVVGIDLEVVTLDVLLGRCLRIF